MLYENGMRKRNSDYARLELHLQELEQKKMTAVKLHDKLVMEINSQSDPAWVELTLMRGLGLVPEGSTKVYFKSRG